MDRQVLTKMVIFWASILVALILVWTGIQMLWLTGRVHPGTVYLLGLICVLAGMYGIAHINTVSKESVWILITIGFYFLAATSGVIRGTWLSRLLGLASFIAAGTIIQMTLPKSEKS